MAKIFVGEWATICGTLRLPTEQRAIAAAMLKDHGVSWSTAGDVVDQVAAIRVGTIRPRGDSTTIDPTFRTINDATQMHWQLKVRKHGSPHRDNSCHATVSDMPLTYARARTIPAIVLCRA
jgi:hypothetical protein